MYLLWILAGCIVLLLLMRFVIVPYATWLMKAFVSDYHDDANIILETGLIPRRWVTTRGTAKRSRYFTKGRALKRLRAIIKYFTNTPMVADEDERAAVLSRLESVYKAWESSSLDEIMPMTW